MVELTASVVCIMMYCCGGIILQTVRGMYIQKVAAALVLGACWVLSLPLSMVWLLVCDLARNLHAGVAIISGTLGLGNAIGCVLACADRKCGMSNARGPLEHDGAGKLLCSQL